MAKRASPGVGHGENLADESAYLRALALETLFGERKKKLNEAHKAARKTIKGAQIPLDDLDTLYKMRDLTAEEIEQWFRRKFRALGSLFRGITKQYDLFAERPVSEEREQAMRLKGRMAGLAGEKPTPPGGLTSDENNEWLGGHHEGADARGAAEPVLADLLGDALRIVEDGGVVDGTKLGPDGKLQPVRKARTKAEKVRQQAAADFAADQEAEKGPGEFSLDTSADSPAHDPDSEGAAERMAEAGMGNP